MADQMRATVASMLKGIDRYNPANIPTLEHYVEMQGRENTYDLEANLAVLKLYQFNPLDYKSDVVIHILLKALTNLPHTDFVLCKCLLDQQTITNEIKAIIIIHDLLETCQFSNFWDNLTRIKVPVDNSEKKESKDSKEDGNIIINLSKYISNNIGFHDSIRKFICHVVNITYQHIEKPVLSNLLGGLQDAELLQWMHKYGWKQLPNGLIFIANQEENVKTKNITEKIDFDSVAAIMATSR